MPDLGRTFLVDNQTGDPYIDPDGNLVMIEGTPLLQQSADTLLHTLIREEFFAMDYGFDFYGIMDGHHGYDFESGIQIAMTEAFDNDSEPLFDGLKWIKVTRTGDHTASVQMSIETAADFDIETTITVGA